MDKEPRIDHLVYNRTWNPEAGKSIDVLHNTRIAYITLDSFKKTDKKYYFCPNCGYPGIRSPKDRAFADNGSPAILKHNSQYPHIECDLKVTSKDLGKHFKNERIRRKAVENEILIVIFSWSDGPKSGPLDKPGSYSGVIENPDSPISGGTIGRHDGERYSITSESQSLTRMAWNLDRFWTRTIWLPDYSEPQHIYDILHHVSQIPSNPERYSMLFWGRVKYMVFNDQFLTIDFRYPTYEITFVIPREIADQHCWTREYLFGRLLMICGQVEENEDPQPFVLPKYQREHRWRVKIEHWGQTALISPKNATLVLEKFQEHWESCPEPDAFIDGSKSKGTDDEPGRQWETGADLNNVATTDGGSRTTDQDDLISDSSTGGGSVGAQRNGAEVPNFTRGNTKQLSANSQLVEQSIRDLDASTRKLREAGNTLDKLIREQERDPRNASNSPETAKF